MRGLKRTLSPARIYWKISVSRRHREAYVFFMECRVGGEFRVQVDGADIEVCNGTIRCVLPNGIMWGCAYLQGYELVNPFAAMHKRWASVVIEPFNLM